MNLRKWFFLFWTCMAVGGAVTILTGSIMQWADQSYGFLGLRAAGFNAFMMALVGLLIGAFSQMGFFAYLTLNYIAMSVLGKRYLWIALQAYTTVFALAFIGYILFQGRDRLGEWLFWGLPLLLVAAAAAAAAVKSHLTNKSAIIPTLFLMVVVTAIEAWPSFQAESNAGGIIFMIVPLLACNAYQILMLHRFVNKEEAGPRVKAKTA
ncbi:KinB-signaling pathway activation protein [Paenibacillus beijingensis]|uniref:KinB signaling pathway activation protein n=1 Tax=Paenibacillus beijingensis TaxID=1126833 RepID=A0A0D5NRU1_9BACL|nr:KinB-signaling pathway activation protein [Paenibacillus beijingensis]AJY77697.1 KinB signaling pathway activation protein [Paenibacillus beijingensis]